MPKKNKEELKKDGLRITPIENGTVIDKITPSRHCFKVLEILELKKVESVVSVVTNVYSKKLKMRKGIIKIEGRELTGDETAKIAVIAPTVIALPMTRKKEKMLRQNSRQRKIP